MDVRLAGMLLANMLVAWLDSGVDQRTSTYANRRRAKFATIRRARNASMHCERRHWNWAGANP